MADLPPPTDDDQTSDDVTPDGIDPEAMAAIVAAIEERIEDAGDSWMEIPFQLLNEDQMERLGARVQAEWTGLREQQEKLEARFCRVSGQSEFPRAFHDMQFFLFVIDEMFPPGTPKRAALEIRWGRKFIELLGGVIAEVPRTGDPKEQSGRTTPKRDLTVVGDPDKTLWRPGS